MIILIIIIVTIINNFNMNIMKKTNKKIIKTKQIK